MKDTIQFTGREISDEAVAQRAYEIWQDRGCPEGTSEEDWETAKAELIAEQQPNRSALVRRPAWLRLLDRLRGKAA